jgi:hypothetical protein
MVIGFRVSALLTGTLFESIGVMTMKMIRTTSMTSTMGVTLISDTGGGAFFNSILFLLPGFLWRDDSLAGQLSYPRRGHCRRR